jgi:hypothetical protein
MSFFVLEVVSGIKCFPRKDEFKMRMSLLIFRKERLLFLQTSFHFFFKKLGLLGHFIFIIGFSFVILA